MRTKQQATFPLSIAAETRIRVDYKANNGLGKNANMEAIYRNLGIFNKSQAYGAMADLYNRRIEPENTRIIEQRKVVKNERARAKRQSKKQTETEVTFVITMTVEIRYIKSWYDAVDNIRYPRRDPLIGLISFSYKYLFTGFIVSIFAYLLPTTIIISIFAYLLPTSFIVKFFVAYFFSVHCVRGEHVQTPIRANNLGLSTSVISSISIEGIQSFVGIDIARDRNVNGEMFLSIFKRDILPICRLPYSAIA